MVLLKNDAGALPLSASSRVLVAGAADDVPMQMGGWSVTWQGTETAAADFPGAVSIWAGVRDAVSAAGGVAEFHADGDYQTRPDAAIVRLRRGALRRGARGRRHLGVRSR